MYDKLKTTILTAFAVIWLFCPSRADSRYSVVIPTDPSSVSFDNRGIYIEDGLKSLEPGAPNINFRIEKVVLPAGNEFSGYSVEKSDPIVVGTAFIDYIVGDLKTGDYPADTALSKNEDIYGSNDVFPENRVNILNKGDWGDIQVVDLAVYPVGYRPLTGEILLYREITVDFELTVKTESNGIAPKSDNLAYKVLAQNALNKAELPSLAGPRPFFGLPKLTTNMPPAEYLIITSGAIAPGFYPFLEWKNQKGIPTDLVLIEDILSSVSGPDPAAQLRNYLIQAYSEGVKWVLLGGDEDVIPIRYLYPGNVNGYFPELGVQQISDLYYADLTGDWDLDGDGVWGESYHDSPDIYPEIYVGRVPARSRDQAQIWSQKAILYETNPGNGDTSYLTKALFICADQMRDYGQHYVLAGMIPGNFTYDVNRLEEQPSGGSPSPTSPFGSQVIDIMNEGWGFISNLNHGSPEWYTAKANYYNRHGYSGVWGTIVPDWNSCGGLIQLTTYDQPAVHYSISCDLAALDFDKGILSPNPYATTYTFTEAYLFEPGGGVAFLGNTRWGWVSSSYNLEKKFIEHLFDDSTSSLYEAEVLSKLDYPNYRDIGYGHNLFGDPEMRMWTSVDGRLTLDGPTQFDLGQQIELNYHAYSDGNPVSNALVCIYLPGDIFMTSLTNDEGLANFVITPMFDGFMTVTATRQNFLPAQLVVTLGMPSGTDDEIVMPKSPSISQNYPNPFNGSTVIEFELPETARVGLAIYNVGGELVKTLASKDFPAGKNYVNWDGQNEYGKSVASGVYFFRFTSGKMNVVKPMTLLK